MTLDQLPAASNRGKVIEMMADRDAELLALHTFLQQSQTTEKNYRIYLDAALKALKDTSREVAAAKTQAEAAAADLRRKHVLESLAMLEGELLDTAHRVLRQLPIRVGELPLTDGYVSVGKRHLGAPLELIPSECWEAGTPDWSTMKLNLDTQSWFGIRIIKIQALLPSEQEIIDALLSSTPKPAESRSGGRPAVAKSALDEFLRKRVAELPPRHADLAEEALTKAAKDHFPKHNVTREAVRAWMKESMPADKKLGRGQKPRTRDLAK